MSKINRYCSNDFTLRMAAVDATDVVQEVQLLQKMFPVASMGVGKAMVGALLLAAQLKEKQQIGLLFRGNGSLKSIYAEANFEGQVRAFTPNPQFEPPDYKEGLKLSQALGKGTLSVSRHTPFQKQPFQGLVELVSGEIGEDIAHYLHQSHQIRSIVGLGIYLDFADAIQRLGEKTIREKYGNLFQMYAKITGEDPYKTPMRIYPAVHYTMGGLWVDYDLMSTIPGMFVLGEANFSDHGANRLGASALMQGLADGYFVLPTTIGDYLARVKPGAVKADHAEFKKTESQAAEFVRKILSINGKRTVDDFHRELGKIMWNDCGMARSEESLKRALKKIPELRAEFWRDVKVSGCNEELNQSLEKAGRVADFLEFGELLVLDALERKESCGGHFRVEYQTDDGEAKRDDENFCHSAVWEYQGDGQKPVRHKEPLVYENIHLATRSYK